MPISAGKRIGFVTARAAGNDGVSLESAKWAEILASYMHSTYWCGGKIDRDPDCSMEVPEAFFEHPRNVDINNRIWGRRTRSRVVTELIHSLFHDLKESLYRFVDRFGIEILIAENVLSLPMHLPLGIALTEFLAETGLPAIAHHHDFYWERPRFSVNSVQDYHDMAFPPNLPNLQHVVINSEAQRDLGLRKGVHAILVPNVLDFENPPPPIDAYAADVRDAIGLERDDVFILQPTRVVPRKGIEHAIELVRQLKNPKIKLVVAHEAGDEGLSYREALLEIARNAGVDLRFFAHRVAGARGKTNGIKRYTLWDVYPHADLITYPSLYEGFGNAFLEAAYYRKPILVNRYSIYVADIEPMGFRTITMDGYLTPRLVDSVNQVLNDPSLREEMTSHNYEIGKRFFSYSVLRRKLRTLITNVTGLDSMQGQAPTTVSIRLRSFTARSA